MTINTHDFDSIRKAMRSNEADTPLPLAVARLQHPFVVRSGNKWLYEGFVSMASAVRQALSEMDESISPDLPPCLLDPSTYARFLRIPLEDFNWQGAGENVVLQKLASIEAKLTCCSARQRQQHPSPDYLSIKEAARLTSVSASHIRRAIRAGELAASNVGTPLRPAWRIARQELSAWMKRQKGGTRIPPKDDLKEFIKRHLPGLS